MLSTNRIILRRCIRPIFLLPILAATLLFQTGCFPGSVSDRFQTSVITDPSGHAELFQMSNFLTILCLEVIGYNPDRTGGGFTLQATSPPDIIQVSGPSPWITVIGPLKHDGSFSLTGTGNVAGFSNVAASFVGSVDSTGNVTGQYSIGINGTIPGSQATVYSMAGPISIPANTPLILPSPWSLQFSAKVGANPPSQTLTIGNAGTGMLGWTATASPDSGGNNWLSIDSGTSVFRTSATVSVNSASLPRGAYTGTITITGVPQGGVSNSPQTVNVQLAVGIPLINDNGVVNGIVNNATYAPGGALSPGTIAAIFGANLTDGTSCLPPTCSPTFGSNGKLNTTMAGAQASIDGTPMPIFYATPGQLGVQIPFELARPTTPPNVIVSVGGQASTPEPVNVAPTSPGIFTYTADGKGAGAITHVDGSAVNAQSPAQRGEVVILYATGLGLVNPAVPTGTLPAGASTTVSPVTLTIGGIAVSPDFAGLSGCCAGLNQINARIPANVMPGTAVPVVLSVSGASSNTATIAVQ